MGGSIRQRYEILEDREYFHASARSPGIGVVNNSGSISEQFWDLRDNHGSFDTNFSDTGQPIYINQQVPKEYDDKTKYGSPTGLSEIMR